MTRRGWFGALAGASVAAGAADQAPSPFPGPNRVLVMDDDFEAGWEAAGNEGAPRAAGVYAVVDGTWLPVNGRKP